MLEDDYEFFPISSDSDDDETALPVTATYQKRVRRNFEEPNDFHERFRVTPRQAEILLQIVGPHFNIKGRTNNALSVKEILLVGLRFFASNSFYYNVADAQGSFVFIQMFLYKNYSTC